MVFPVSTLHEVGYFQGFSKHLRTHLHSILAESFFVRRGVAEADTSLKQIIPYAVLQHDNLVFSYRRTARGRETRLHRLYSVGIGGHINPEDPSTACQRDLFACSLEAVEVAALREIREEVSIKSSSRACIGVLNDDSTNVGKVHFGVVYLCSLDTPEVTIRERSYIKEGRLVSLSSLHSYLEEYENWSRILIQSVSEWFPKSSTKI